MMDFILNIQRSSCKHLLFQVVLLQTGTVTFYSLESQNIVGECKVPGEITDLQICFDDSLDLLTLLVRNRNKYFI